jgi:DNA helicase TIP49 (TBP-interacting protein)
MGNEDATKVADLRVALNNLLRAHVTTNLTVSRDIVDGASQAKIDGAKAAQTANAVAIAETVGSVYGDEAKQAITTPFVEHLNQSNNYAQAVKDGNEAMKESSLAALRVQLRNVADVFNSVIPSVSSDALYEALSAHEDLINQAAVEYNNGNFEKAYELENEALTQISGGAEVLATGIVASKPDMF